MHRRRNFTVPEELRTSERLMTRREAIERESLPRCPSVPMKSRNKSVGHIPVDQSSLKAKTLSFMHEVSLSPLYNPKSRLSYFEQIFCNYGTIGEGSFGTVYRARSREDLKLYAVKKLKTKTSLKVRCAEVRNNEKIGLHPNFVQFFMAWEEEDMTYMLLEYCDMSLADFAQQGDELPEEMLWDVLVDVCKALFYLHSQKYVHLDVKPENILAKGEVYKLGDFGLLVDLNASDNKTSTLSDGDAKYMAKEVLQGIYTPACDIFGLGVSLLELASGIVLPHSGPLWQQIRHNILPVEFYKKVTLGFQVIVEKMVADDYKSRPLSGELLKYYTIKQIEKRNLKIPRTNYVPEHRRLEGLEFLPLSPIDPNRGAAGESSSSDSDDAEEHPSGALKRSSSSKRTPAVPKLVLSRKSLLLDFVESEKWENSDGFDDENINPEGSLAEELSLSPMEIDDKRDNNNENHSSLNESLAITSTPILKAGRKRYSAKAKLEFK